MRVQNFMHKEFQLGKNQLLELGKYIQESFKLCKKSLMNFDYSLAKEVIKRDDYVDEKEVIIEQQIISFISLYQPVAGDLRLIITMLKVNHDLERIHDSITNVCRTVRALKEEDKLDIPDGFIELFNIVGEILDKALDAFAEVDSKKALEACQKITQLKEIKSTFFDNIENFSGSSEEIELFLHISFTFKNAYRIGKYAINIAEDIYYLKEGDIIRHHHPNIEKA